MSGWVFSGVNNNSSCGMSKNISREKIKEENFGYHFSSEIEIKSRKANEVENFFDSSTIKGTKVWKNFC